MALSGSCKHRSMMGADRAGEHSTYVGPDAFNQIFQLPQRRAKVATYEGHHTARIDESPGLWQIVKSKTKRNVRHEIVDAFMEKHVSIMELGPDWDGMGSLRVTECTWHAAVAAMETIYRGPDKGALNLPDLSPTPKGGLVMQWETHQGFLLLHVSGAGEGCHLTARLRDGSKMDAPFTGSPLPDWARPLIRRR